MRLMNPIPWMGSKTRMRSKIYPLINSCFHECYVEPFGGSGSMFFGRDPQEDNVKEVYNDLNGLLCCLFRVLRDTSKVEELQRLCLCTPHSRRFWYELKELCLAYLSTDEERIQNALALNNLASVPLDIAVAFAFFYCQNFGFAGKYLSSFGTGKLALKRKSLPLTYAKRVQDLPRFSRRLRAVTIENLDFKQVFKKYDLQSTLFYCDPPYEGATGYNIKECNFGKFDAQGLVETLLNAKGSVVLSCYFNDIYKPLLDAGYERVDFKSYVTACRMRDETKNRRIETVLFKIRHKDGLKPTLLESE